MKTAQLCGELVAKVCYLKSNELLDANSEK